ncbi:hypothetical protein [Pseudomonas abietaniphila]|uniref:hypothetical protein n=1 Tax=Pseudomonas abietaniphila TaxID=89065 RepID=UPI0007847DF4|nr:hypothetical protein [Pseudomonas abietaniphila]
MINHTDKPIWLAHLGKIDSEIRHCLKEASEFIKKEYGMGAGWSYESITSGPKTVQLSFLKYFQYAPHLTSVEFSNEWMCEAFKYIAVPSGDTSEVDMGLLFGAAKSDYKKSVYTWVKRGLWLMFVMLYKSGCVSLPANFSALSYNSGRGAQGTRTDFAFETYPELMKFLVSSRYKLFPSDFWGAVPKKVCERMAQYGTRLFWMCGVTAPEQINIDDVIEVHLAYTLGERTLTAEIPTKSIMQYVCHYYQDRVPFTLEHYLIRLEEAVRARRTNSRRVPDTKELDISENAEDAEDAVFRDAALWVKRDYLPSRIVNLQLFNPWADYLKPRLGVWLISQKKYVDEKNYEREHSSAIGIAWLNAYLFEFLPRWYATNGLSWDVGYPSTPAELTNAIINPVERADNAPPSFHDFLERVLPENAETAPYTINNQLRAFFEWVELKFQHVIGYEGFKNPIHEMDMPLSNHRAESKARPFTKWQYSIALNYLATIFRAVRLINDRLISGHVTSIADEDLTNLAVRLGWDNTFYCSGRLFTVSVIPAVFLESWNIPVSGNKFITLLSPHYVVHVLTAVDSGLRHQSVRWLCTCFDKFAVEVEGAVAFKLHVAVDKVSNTPVETHVAKQTFEALKYQREIRSMVDLDTFKVDIFYRGNANTKKGKFKPLFSKNLRTGHPNVEGAYEKAYVKFLVGFNFFLNDHGLGSKFFELKAKGFSYGEKVTKGVESRTTEGVLYCPLSLVTDMTPHHTRSSTVNTWSRFLTAKDVGQFKTAHRSEGVVRYYRKLDAEDRAELSRHLTSAVNQIWSGDSVNPALEDSSFRRAVASDPKKAIHDFGCISISAMGSDKEAEGVHRIANGHHSGLAHYPTHICSRNGDCTEEMKAAGTANRCGFCIYAVKGIDNLEAIEVKIVNLTDEVRSLHEYADGLSGKNQHELIKVDNRLEIVVSDLLAWIWCRDHLVSVAEKFKSDPVKLFSYRPSILEKDFRKFNVDEESAIYVLSRLHLDSQFPELISDLAKAKYKALKISLLGGRASTLDIFRTKISDSSVELVSMIRSMIKQSGMSVEDLAVAWEKQDARTSELLANHNPIFLSEEE